MIQVVKRVAEILAVIEDAGGLPLREIAGRTGLRKTGGQPCPEPAGGELEQDERRCAVGPAPRRLGWEGLVGAPGGARGGSVRALSIAMMSVVGVGWLGRAWKSWLRRLRITPSW